MIDPGVVLWLEGGMAGGLLLGAALARLGRFWIHGWLQKRHGGFERRGHRGRDGAVVSSQFQVRHGITRCAGSCDRRKRGGVARAVHSRLGWTGRTSQAPTSRKLQAMDACDAGSLASRGRARCVDLSHSKWGIRACFPARFTVERADSRQEFRLRSGGDYGSSRHGRRMGRPRRAALGLRR